MTADERRISDWSSDVCSSDLLGEDRGAIEAFVPFGPLDRGHQPVPIGIGGDEHLGKGDELRAVPSRLGDQRAGLVDRRGGIDRTNVVRAKNVAVRVDLGGRRHIKKKKSRTYKTK